MVYPAIETAEMLHEKGISAAVVNARFVKPADKDLILPLIRQIGKIITVEEHVLSCGFGSSITEMLVQGGEIPGLLIEHIGLPDEFIEHGDREKLLQLNGLTSDGIFKFALRMLGYNEGAEKIPKTRHTAGAAR